MARPLLLRLLPGLPGCQGAGLVAALWIITVLVLGCVYGAADEEDWVLAELQAARCRVRCVAKLTQGMSIKEAFGIKNINGLAKCLEDMDCSACMKPCGLHFTSISECTKVCLPEESACEQNCHYLRHITTQRPGTCPEPDQVTGFAAACIDVCQTDADCERRQKCCENGCGMACVDPHHPFAGVPTVPRDLSVRERPNGASLELSWLPPSSNSSLILYVLQSKWNIGKHPRQDAMTPWRHATMSTRTSAVVRDIKPGTWYQFRVAAVNVNGSKGFTEPTKAFRLSREPKAPSSPENFTEGNTKIQDGTITVTVHWQHPKKTELPVSRYKVFWSKRLKSVTAQLQSLTEHKQALSGNQLHFDLENLDSDTTYFVQVQAISFYGEARLKSERASMYITTYAMPQATQEEGPTPQVVIQPLPTLSSLINVSVDEPYYHNGLLKANLSWVVPKGQESCTHKALIHWTPEVCIADSILDGGLSKSLSATTHDMSIEIYELRFDCRYVIKVQPVCQAQVGPVSHITLQTPSCGEVIIKGTLRPDCPTDEPSVPGEPRNVQHSFLIVHLNITAKISWEPPVSDTPLLGYRIIWGQTLSGRLETQQPVLDQNAALTKVLPKTWRIFSIGNLDEGKSYIVRLTALSRVGSGHASTIHFHTPQLQPTPIEPPYGIDNGREPQKKKEKEAKQQSTTTMAPTKKQEKLEASQQDQPNSAARPSSGQLAFPLALLCIHHLCYLAGL